MNNRKTVGVEFFTIPYIHTDILTFKKKIQLLWMIEKILIVIRTEIDEISLCHHLKMFLSGKYGWFSANKQKYRKQMGNRKNKQTNLTSFYQYCDLNKQT